MLWLPLVLLFVIIMYLCVAAVTETPKDIRGDRAAELLRDVLYTFRRNSRHRG